MLKYNCPKGKRVKKRYFVWTIIDFDEPERKNYWWDVNLNKWRNKDDIIKDKHSASNVCGCRSVRQFRRLLRKWKEYMPKGTKFLLVNRFDCWNVKGTL